jgi:hypothetical protein
MKYLILYADGCNGLRRSGVTETLPTDAYERNPGEGVYELDEGSYAIEIRENDVTWEDDEEEEEDPD